MLDPSLWEQILGARTAIDANQTSASPPRFPDPVTNEGWRHHGVGLWELALVRRGKRYVVAHLGQSIDGRIATDEGHSHYIGGQASLQHLHALRALSDAVVVGVGTVLADAPKLTTRHVEGPNPVRVVIDPNGRLPATTALFADKAAPVFVVHKQGSAPPMPAHVNGIALQPEEDGRLAPRAIVEALASIHLHRLLIEGGGRTVSGFLEAQVLDRLQFAVAPLIIGSGRPAMQLPVISTLDQALRPRCTRSPLGADTLYDFDLRANTSK